MVSYLGIDIDYTRDSLLPEKGLEMLTREGFYKKPNEDSPQESFARAATAYCFGDYSLAQRVYDGVSKGWAMYASPVLSNAEVISWPDFGKDGFDKAAEWLEQNVKTDCLPISCFLSKIPDTRKGLVDTRAEVSWLSMNGGGVGVYASNRSPDEKSTGVMAHLAGYDKDTLAYRQTEKRRGSIAAYLDINHPEIKSFIQMRNPVGGDTNKKCFNLNNAINITDDFMQAVAKGEDYELIDPKHGATGKFLNAREVWEEILDMRFQTGEPYLNFIDTVNRTKPIWIKNPLYKISQSNLCNEIHLMTSDRRTAVCCLSSLNLDKYDEWKDTSFVEDMIRFLDNVLEYFIRLADKDALKRAIYSAKKERALGLGTFGYHSYFKRNSISFESSAASSATYKMFSNIKSKAVSASLQLAKERGECDDVRGSGMRNSHLLAIAPNANSADILGVSPSIEPSAGNCYNSQGRAGSFLIKDTHLEALLETKGKNTPDVWKQILEDNGSVHNLDFLSEHEKNVYKAGKQINPQWIIEHAALRQEFVCQGQSLNIQVYNNITKQEMSDIHWLAWKKGVKGLYYCRTESVGKVNVGTGGAAPLNSIPVKFKIDIEECLSCQG